ncbi:hypothetical protein [Paenibacillus polymyxa]|nr:hypothetical protein [Paenibacillus polymyxa]
MFEQINLKKKQLDEVLVNKIYLAYYNALDKACTTEDYGKYR